MRTLLTTLHSKYIHASLALPYLAAYCGEDCGELVIREYTVHEPKESVLAQIVALEPEAVVFSVYLWNRLATLELVDCLKLISPDLKIVLGGPDVSFEDETFFPRYPIDALISGEGEIPLRQLLQCWQGNTDPKPTPGLRTRIFPQSNGQSSLSSLDALPSPFAARLVDLNRGLVYYESSRGCPYTCSFCMSALDNRVRSFSMTRIFADLQLLMTAEVPQIKLVDRTFNYDNGRAREIFDFILRKNVSSHFHFEIGAHLLDEETLRLLETVPEGMVQFEIGVQSTLPETLDKIGRRASLGKLAENVRRLRQKENIHLHLDLIAGLPGENYRQVLNSLDWVAALHPHHLQLEPVKLLPGAPLRSQATEFAFTFDPNPPYTILGSPDLNFQQLERLRGIGRLVDLLVNSGRFRYLLPLLVEKYQFLSIFLEILDDFWRAENLYHGHRSLRELFGVMDRFLQQNFSAEERPCFREALVRDFAHQERIVSGSEPEFFSGALTATERELVRQRVKEEIGKLIRTGKVQYFAGAFHHLPDSPGRSILIFLYNSNPSGGMQVTELRLDS